MCALQLWPGGNACTHWWGSPRLPCCQLCVEMVHDMRDPSLVSLHARLSSLKNVRACAGRLTSFQVHWAWSGSFSRSTMTRFLEGPSATMSLTTDAHRDGHAARLLVKVSSSLQAGNPNVRLCVHPRVQPAA